MPLWDRSCAWSADPECERTPDAKYDALLVGCRWCARCGPIQIERQSLLVRLLDDGHGERLEEGLAALDDERITHS